MANFPRHGSVHGTQGPDYTQAPQQHNQQRRPPPPNNFGMRGRIAQMIQNHADKQAERNVNYVLGMQHQLEQHRDYRETGTYRDAPDDYGPAAYQARHAPTENVSPQVMAMFEQMHARIDELEAHVGSLLESMRDRMGPGRSSPPPSVAGHGGYHSSQSVVSDHFPVEPRIVEVDEFDEEDQPQNRPHLPLRRPTAPTASTLPTVNAGSGEVPELPLRNPPLTSQTSQRAQTSQRQHFPPPPLHPSHPRAAQRQAEIAASESGVDIEQWRRTSATAITEPEEDEDRFTDNTTGTSQHRPLPPTRREFMRRPLPTPQNQADTTPGQAAGADSALNNQRTQDISATLTANARVETQFNEEGRKAAIHNTR